MSLYGTRLGFTESGHNPPGSRQAGRCSCLHSSFNSCLFEEEASALSSDEAASLVLYHLDSWAVLDWFFIRPILARICMLLHLSWDCRASPPQSFLNHAEWIAWVKLPKLILPQNQMTAVSSRKKGKRMKGMWSFITENAVIITYSFILWTLLSE